MVAWPGTLPQSPQVAGNSTSWGDNRLSFKPDVGRLMFRARTSVRDDELSLTFQMTRAQLTTLESFYKTDLGNGVLPFTWLDTTINATRTFQFKSPPQASAIQPFYFQVTLSLVRFGV